MVEKDLRVVPLASLENAPVVKQWGNQGGRACGDEVVLPQSMFRRDQGRSHEMPVPALLH